jgi:predicted RNA-binding Zn ribbon-like protein
VDFESYARRAVTLANTDRATPGQPRADRLTTVEDLRSLVPDWPALADGATGRDLAQLRRLRGRIQEVFAAAADDGDQVAVARINELLAEHPIRPEISGHDHSSWHLHVTGPGAPMHARVAAEALMGLAMTVIDLGADRLGTCAAPGCEQVFLDTSRNRSRRFCSDRCSTRVAVAAHRARQRT